ncbi:MAG: HEPN domain-containing protein [Actinomycetota bacterium]|nr:HEPN domain-containing protein [Actinomycetota bacterium]MDI6821534.1 HEPN domain-containing protein [Actinomycetota bacterium]
MQQHEKWLSRAEDDLKFARLGLENAFYAQVCFLAQQSVEKSLKAFLLFNGRLYPKTHKLVELWPLCYEIKTELLGYEKEFKVIDGYYIPTRYPDAVPASSVSMPSLGDAKEALNAAEDVHRIIKRWIEKKSS